MAKKEKADADQMQLIDVEDALAKPLREEMRAYESENDQKNEHHQKAKKIKEKILAMIRERGIKPDVDGVIKFRMDGVIYKITQGESKLTFKEESIPVDDKPEDKGEEVD